MALILVGIGLVFCLIFHVGTKEPIYEMNKKMSIKVAEIMVGLMGSRLTVAIYIVVSDK